MGKTTMTLQGAKLHDNILKRLKEYVEQENITDDFEIGPYIIRKSEDALITMSFGSRSISISQADVAKLNSKNIVMFIVTQVQKLTEGMYEEIEALTPDAKLAREIVLLEEENTRLNTLVKDMQEQAYAIKEEFDKLRGICISKLETKKVVELEYDDIVCKCEEVGNTTKREITMSTLKVAIDAGLDIHLNVSDEYFSLKRISFDKQTTATVNIPTDVLYVCKQVTIEYRGTKRKIKG